MFKITAQDMCTGCGACSNICPTNCIKIIENEKSGGFLEPDINYDKCIQCNSCIKICPINNSPLTKLYTKKAYACINKNSDIRINSTSGGIFFLLADYIIKNNGIVFGAIYDNEMKVIHSHTNNINDIYKFMGSKYVQSFTGNCYRKCKEYLDAGMPVLFTGTPCQIGGLKKFLRKDYSNLICQDLICHGVPSCTLWKKYLNHIEKKYNNKVINYIFRSKYKGWNKPGIEIIFADGKHKYSFLDKETYSKFFLNYSSLRESCYNCQFRGDNRVSDITLGDFWGIENVLPDKYDNKGTSIVIINTDKGFDIFNKISEYIDYTEVSMKQGLEKNPSFYYSPSKSLRRNHLVLNTRQMSYNKLILSHGKYVLIKMEIKRILKPAYNFIRKLLK